MALNLKLNLVKLNDLNLIVYLKPKEALKLKLKSRKIETRTRTGWWVASPNPREISIYSYKYTEFK